ncbi:histone H1-like [Senna tora]|uniref:Histone H1-like n=1 Tax=Senna tora TaxID=362788 RepID=A0A835CCI7_9FABA|nr:histone H1-like [Senna tora]
MPSMVDLQVNYIGGIWCFWVNEDFEVVVLKKHTIVVESLLSKVVEECERCVLIQHEMGPISDSDVGISGSGAQYTYDKFPSNIRTEKQLEEKRKQILATASSAFEYLGRHTPRHDLTVVGLFSFKGLSLMIYNAIAALKKRNGSSKRAIAKYIDQTFTHLPSTHSALLTLHLKRLKSKGVLVMVKKSYKFARSYASSHPTQPKRGRPRKPKPKPKPNPEQPQSLEARNNAKRILVALGLEEELANSGVKKRGLGRPPKDSAVEEQATSDSDDLRRKLRYFQSKVRESLVPIKGIIQELETLASMDLN